MLLLHLGIPPSGHGYAPPIAVAIITVLAKKGLYSAEMHLRVYYSSAPSLSKKLSVNGEKTVLASQSAPRRHDASPALPNFQRKRPPHSHWRNGAANWRNTFFFSFFTNPEFPFQKPVIASLAIGLEPSSLPPVSDISFHKKEREKERLEHSGLDSITSFPCRACHVSDDVSLYKGNPSFRPCPRCGQSNRGCLLLNIRLPE